MDIKLNYQEKGEGDPFILLHGNGDSSHYFYHQIEFLSQNFHVFAIDTRGHGKSPRGEGPFTISRFADDLYEFMVEHEIERADILGFSDGGNTALTFALRHPKMVKRLILNGANLFPKGMHPWIRIPITIGYKINSFRAKRGNEKAVQKAEMLGLMVNEPNISPDELKNLRINTFVIAGTKDVIKKSHSNLIFDSLPKAQLTFVEGNHCIAAFKPFEFNNAIEYFLNDTATMK